MIVSLYRDREHLWFVSDSSCFSHAYTDEQFVQFLREHPFRVLCSRRLNTRIQFLDSSTYSFIIPTEIYHQVRGSTTSNFVPTKFGVELEFCCPRSNINLLKTRLSSIVPFQDRSSQHGCNSTHDWILTYDGSLSNGPGYQSFELVSPPMKVNDLSDLQSVLTVMNELDCFVNRKCGTHVHFSFTQRLTETKLTELYRAYYRWESFFDKLVSPSRRGNVNYYCGSCTGDWERTRYHKFNPCAYSKHGTVEVRQHQGTLSFTKISHWISLFLKWFPNYSKCIGGFADALDKLGFNSSEKEWYLNRMAELE